MAISRFKTSTLAQGLPKYTELWDQTTTYGVPTNNLVAKYETPPSSGTTWTDTVGGYNISLTSTTYNSDNGGYLSFDGTNSYGDASSFPTLSTANDITFAMWVYPTTLSGTSYGNSKMIMGMSTADPSYLVALGATKFFLNGFTQSGFEVNHGMSVNNWYLLLWTHKVGASTGKVYVNNSVVSSSLVPLGANKAQPFSIGRERTGLNTNRFAGRMGSVYYWNKELTATEATQVWDYSRGRFGL